MDQSANANLTIVSNPERRSLTRIKQGARRPIRYSLLERASCLANCVISVTGLDKNDTEKAALGSTRPNCLDLVIIQERDWDSASEGKFCFVLNEHLEWSLAKERAKEGQKRCSSYGDFTDWQLTARGQPDSRVA
jgi:hypothetical protein